MDLWRKGGFRYLWREWRERAREQDMKERGHAIPRLPAVPETPMELLTSAFLTLASSLYLSCLKSSTISRLTSLNRRFACTAIPGMTKGKFWEIWPRKNVFKRFTHFKRITKGLITDFYITIAMQFWGKIRENLVKTTIQTTVVKLLHMPNLVS